MYRRINSKWYKPILYSFALDKPRGFEFFCEPETIFFKIESNKSVLNNLTFCLEDDDGSNVDFNGETLTFTLILKYIKNMI